MIITPDDYFGSYQSHPELKPEYRTNAEIFLPKVDQLIQRASEAGIKLVKNPSTGTHISGEKNGGWRPMSCPIGAPRSSHKIGRGVDIYDPDGELDNWIIDNIGVLQELDLAIEHPAATRTWCHITDRLPPSGRRVFYP